MHVLADRRNLHEFLEMCVSAFNILWMDEKFLNKTDELNISFP